MRIACIGECMIELSDAADGLTRSYGGDTLNTAVYMARLGRDAGVQVDYVTALGDDPYSDEMVAGWRAEGIGVDRVRRQPGRTPGLYMIRTAAAGERSFYYWRNAAPAKALFDGPAGMALVDVLAGYDWLYFTGVTLGVLTVEGRLALFETLRRTSAAGGRIAYDSNYRPRLWDDAAEARAANEVALGWADIALPGFDDERALYGDRNPAATAARIARAGVAEVVVKDGANDILLRVGGAVATAPANPHPAPVDTTAAGDSFNAGYIAARAAGQAPEAAAAAGAALAGKVVGVRGAVIPADLFWSLDL